MNGSGDGEVLVVAAFVSAHLVAAHCAAVDLVEHRIPNRSVLVMGAAALAAGALDGHTPSVLVGALSTAGPLWLLRFGNGVGLGDVKFAAALGAVGGLVSPLVGLVGLGFSAISSATYGVWCRRQRLALAPWLWLGAVAAAGLHLCFAERLPWPT